VTRYLLDVASYQGDLRAEDVQRAGFTAVNLKVSHGLSRKSVHPDITGWVDQARALGLGVCTFHYFTADAPGTDQAEYAYARLAELGLTYGTAHQVDVESAPAPGIAEVRAYLERMTQLLGRPIALYTGDWWWTARKGWDVHDLSPYLWAAPNVGYVGSYPGDESGRWTAGYGGWPALSVMQYAVGPLAFPDATRGTIDVSKSAIRDETVWRDLTQGRPGMSFAPASLSAARKVYMDCLARAGFAIAPSSVGIVGDESHAKAGNSYHLGEDALRADSYTIVESSRDRNGLSNAASAIDFGKFTIVVDGKTHNLRTFSLWVVGECEAGAPDTADIREVIYSPDGKVVKRWDRLKKRTTGDSSHLEHTHVSRFRDAENSPKLTALITRYFTEIGVLEDEDMPNVKEVADEVEKRMIALFATRSQADGTPTSLIGQRALDQGVPDGTRAGAPRDNAWAVLKNLGAMATKSQATLDAILKNVVADDGDRAAIIAEINARAAVMESAIAGVPLDVLDALGSGNEDMQVTALKMLLGSRAAAVGARLAA
jgi:hypothetical protein